MKSSKIYNRFASAWSSNILMTQNSKVAVFLEMRNEVLFCINGKKVSESSKVRVAVEWRIEIMQLCRSWIVGDVPRRILRSVLF